LIYFPGNKWHFTTLANASRFKNCLKQACVGVSNHFVKTTKQQYPMIVPQMDG